MVDVGPMPYPVVNTLLDDTFPKGALNYWKSAFFTELYAAVRTMGSRRSKRHPRS